MKIKVLFKIALKNLIAQRARTFLTVLGVALGVGAIVFLVSLGYGLEEMTVERVANFETLFIFDAQTGGSKLVKLDSKSIKKIKEVANVAQVEPLLTTPAKVKYREATTEMVLYSATKGYLELSEIKTMKGEVFEEDDSNQVLINLTLLSGLGETEDSVIGKEVTISAFLDKELAPDLKDEEREVEADYVISGLIDDSGTAFVYVPFGGLGELGATDAQTVKVKVGNRNKIEETRKQVENMGYLTVYVGDTIAQITSFFQIFRIILGLFGMIAVVIALLGMLNTLTISLLERTREVGLMKVLGMRKKGVRNLFLAEATIVGLLGGASGLVLGILFAKLIDGVLWAVARATENPVLQIFSFPVLFLAAVFFFTLVIAVLTGLYPARRATRIEPLEALRYE